MLSALPMLLAPVLWALLRTGERRLAGRLEGLVGARRNATGWQRDRRAAGIRHASLALALLFGALALALPDERLADPRSDVQGADVVIALDVSRSMLAQDVAPSRLQRARRQILSLVGRATGERVALVLFAGEARLHIPLTQDALSFASLLSTVGPASVTAGGTDLGAALEEAARAFPADGERLAVIVLLSDGEDLEGRGRAAAEALAERDVIVHAIGFGSARGSKIAVPSAGGTAFLRDRGGEEVISALDASGLANIAAAAGGTYVDVRSDDDVAAKLYERVIRPAAATSADPARSRRRGFPYQLPLALAFLFACVALALRNGRLFR